MLSSLASAIAVTRFVPPRGRWCPCRRPACRSCGHTLRGERPTLLVPRQDRANLVLVPRERLVERHARPARVGEDHVAAVADERLDHHVGPGDEGFGRFRRTGNGGHEEAPGGRRGPADRPSTIHDENRPKNRSPSRYASSATGLVRRPIRSISTVTVSPGWRKTGGFRAKPTPWGFR